MDTPIPTFAMVLVACAVVGLLWLAAAPVRKTRRRVYSRALIALPMLLALIALAGIGLNWPEALVDWLIAFGFPLTCLSISNRLSSREEDDAKLAEIDTILKEMRDTGRNP